MKHINLYLGMTALLLASCSVQEKDFQTPMLEDTLFYALFEQPADDDTKVYVNEDLLLRWTADDRVSIFNKNTYNQQYAFTGETGDNAGGFRKVDSDEFVTGNAISNVVSVYPFQAATKISESETITVNLPAEQTYVENTFGLGANTMVSVSSDNFLQYKNVGGYLILKMYGDGVSVSSITLKGNNGEKLAGKATVSIPLDGVPRVVMADDATSEITLTCPELVKLGTTAEESTQFWFVVPPVTFSKGFTITVKQSSGGVYEKSTSKSITIERNKLTKMAPMEVETSTLPPASIPEAIDLGLSVKWASFNLGATAPEEYGDYFAWGDTEPYYISLDPLTWKENKKDGYSFASYKWCVGGDSDSITKYCSDSEYGYNGFTDNKTVLDLEDDAAYVNLGDKWRMPTDAEWTELRENCTWTWTTQKGVSGMLFTASNGNSIFLPAAGSMSYALLSAVSNGRYWSSSLCSDIPSNPWSVWFYSGGAFRGNGSPRCIGLSVRPVYGEPPMTGNIVFADPSAKSACVEKFDTNGDGEVSIEEAEAVTSFEGLFNDWKGIVSFDEIRYFKNVHSLSGVFNGCNKLVSITVPENITDLGTSAFSGCTLLSSVMLPSRITYIGDYSFQDCSSLCSVSIPSNVTSIGQYAFWNCFSMTSLDLPSQLKTIDQGAFEGCSSLTQIDIPDGVTSLGDYAFSGCNSLLSASIPDGITSIPGYCFYYCSSLASVFIPEGVTSIGDSAFDGVKMWKLELPSSISSLGNYYCFGDITCIILPSTSPVTIQSHTFNGVQEVFVPSNLIDIYGAMPNYWLNFALRIHSIDTYRDENEFTLVTSGAVDMGTSVKWAAYNLGATRPEEYGDYYAWGEIEPYYSSQDPLTWKEGKEEGYRYSSYKWCNGDNNNMTKYCPADMLDYWDGSGLPDDKAVLDPEDDAAHDIWGEAWRLPTYEEWIELMMGCIWKWTTYKGINGFFFYSLGSCNAIFLPAAGNWNGSRLYRIGARGVYWSSSLRTDGPSSAWSVEFSSGSVDGFGYERFIGQSVRPVYAK